MIFFLPMDKPEIDPKTGLWKDPQPFEPDGLDYEVDYMSSSADYMSDIDDQYAHYYTCLLYTSPSPRDRPLSRMPSSA